VRLTCSACGVRLTDELARVEPSAIKYHGDGQPTLPLLSFAVDPEPVLSIVHLRDESEQIIERAPRNAIVVRPDSLCDGAVEVSGNAAGCCGLDGLDGPNQSCASCHAVLGTARTDCWTPHEIRFVPEAVTIADSDA
jgi:hypothetical protein